MTYRLLPRAVSVAAICCVAAGVGLGASSVSKAAFQGSNGQVMFMAFDNPNDHTNNGQLWTMELGTDTLGRPIAQNEQLLADASHGHSPSFGHWSRNGQLITFTNRDERNHEVVWQVSASGRASAVQLDDTHSLEGQESAFTHEGKIGFIRPSAASGAIAIRESDGTLPAVRTPAFKYRQPVWATNGMPAFVRKSLLQHENIWIRTADGHKRRITHTKTNQHYSHPSWSPDGQRLAFSRQGRRHHKIFVADLTGLPAALATNRKNISALIPKEDISAIGARLEGGVEGEQVTDAAAVQWSPDGQRLIFSVKTTVQPNLWRLAVMEWGTKEFELVRMARGSDRPNAKPTDWQVATVTTATAMPSNPLVTGGTTSPTTTTATATATRPGVTPAASTAVPAASTAGTTTAATRPNPVNSTGGAGGSTAHTPTAPAPGASKTAAAHPAAAKPLARISSFKLTLTKFAVDQKSKFIFTLTSKADVKVIIKRASKKRGAPAVIVGTTKVISGKAGRNQTPFAGRVIKYGKTRTLSAGRYTAQIVIKNAAGKVMQRKSVPFEIKKKTSKVAAKKSAKKASKKKS